MLCITLLAIFLRFYKLGTWSFWGDEVFTLSSRSDGFIPSLTTRLIHATTTHLGVNEWNARLIPAMVGLITIPLLFILVAKTFGNDVGLISSALLATSTWHIYWSQNARFYTLLLLFYSLALFTFHIGLEKDRPWCLALSLIFLGLAIQERLIALMLLPVIIIYLFLLFVFKIEKPMGLRLRNLVIFFAPAIFTALFFTTPILANLSDWIAGFGRINTNPVWLSLGLVYYIGLPLFCMASFGVLYLCIQRDRAGLFFGLSAAVPPAAIMIISLSNYAANRYFFISLTSWILLASLASLELLKTQNGKKKLLAIGVLVLLVLTNLGEDYLYYQYQNGNREDARAAYELIKDQANVDDLIFAANPELAGYYLSQQVSSISEFDERMLTNQDLQTWFVIDMTTEELFPNKYEWIKEHTQYVENFDVAVRGRIFIMQVYYLDTSLE